MSTAALLLLAVVQAFAGGKKDYRFSHLTVKQGLSQNNVICILQDSRGFMWFGTQDGLNRFDGYGVTVYKNDPTDSATISENFIVFMAEDSAGTLWFGTRGTPELLNRFERTTERFTRHPRDKVDLAGARISAARMEFVDASGARWAGSNGQGLIRTDPAPGTTTAFRHDPNNPASLIDDRVYSVAGDRDGTIWVATHEGLDRLDPRTGVFTHYRNDPKNPRSLSDNYVWPLLVDRDGVLWAGTFRGGLNRFDAATGTFDRYRPDEANPHSLAADRLYALYQDVSGVIWVGTGNFGVDYFHPGLINFEHYFHSSSSAGGLADNNIASLYVDRSGAVWIGTLSGLNRLDRNTGKFTLYKNDPKNPNTIASDAVQVMLEDRSGALWIGTISNGLDCLDRKTGKIRHYRNDPADPASLSDNRIYALCEDRKGNLWVGTYGGGVCRLDRRTGKFERFVHDDSVPGSLAGPGAWALLEDREGTLWVGTYGGGLDRLNPDGKSFTHYASDPARPGSISDNIIVTLLEDSAGALWIGTSNGLNRLDRQTNTFRAYHEKDGLANEVIFGILADRKGNLWMSTNKGVSMFDPRTDQFRNYDSRDGLQGDEFNQGAYGQDPRSGEILFGGSNGFNIFQPESLRQNTYVPPVVFTSFVRYNTDDNEGKPIRDAGIDALPAITLSYKDNVVNFEFAALSYYNNDKNRYAYRLTGYNNRWIQLGPERRATFTNLDGGEYTLQVKGSNDNGIWNEQGASLRITVNPPWWKTRWAYGAYATLILAFLYGARRVEINRREQKTRVRESELRAKAAEAEKRALAAENDRKTKELEDARQLQLSMLPKKVPTLPGYEIAVFMKTATEVGGDYYDFSVSPDGDLNVAVGDATGHGMQAGTIVTLMKGLFVSEVNKFGAVAEFLNHCSRSIKEINLGRLYMALALARIHGNRISLSSAGMPPAFLYRKATGCVDEVLLKAVPLGTMRNFNYPLYEADMEDGDMLLLLTDGLPEQKNAAGEMYDYPRINDCFRQLAARPPEEIIHQLINNGDGWMNGVAQEDDITLLLIKKTENTTT